MEATAVLDGVTYTYPGRDEAALQNVSLRLDPAEIVLLIGGSGSGKSTLLRALCGLVPHFHGGTFAGRVMVAGLDTRVTPARELARYVGMVFQDPENQAVMASVERELAFGLENLGLGGTAITRAVEESLISMGLGHLRHAGLATLSGGELQKVALAAVLAMQPELLLLDEPTSKLDPVGSEDLLAAVRRLAEDTGSTVVLAEHRTERCLSMATRVLYMAEGTIVADSDPHEFAAWAAEHHPELLPPVARLFAARRRRATQGHVGQALPMTVKEARRQLSGMPEGAVRPSPALCPPAVDGTDHQKPVIEVRRLTAGYPPEDPVLEDVDLKLWPGAAIAVMGANGAGKSTLVRHFNGMGRPLAGEVRLSGRDVGRLSIAEAARLCAYLGQDPGAYFVRDSVSEELDYSFDALGVAADAREVRRREIVAELDLEGLLERDPRDLSGGERTRVALAIVTCGDPLVVVLDEPTRGMDPAHKSALSVLLRRWAARGRCVVLVTHDVEFAARTASRVVLLGDGGVLADDPVREALHGSLFFSTQVNRLLRHEVHGAIVEDDVSWTTAP